jgi:peptidoglycan/xylan/chitin deacetylase (PgdA/CDA1 family)
MYHSIGTPTQKENQRYSCAPERFDTHLAFIRSRNQDVVGLDVLKECLRTGREPKRDSIVITFDDGFLDNYTNALPILERYEYPATVFVTVGFIGNEHNGAKRKTFMGKEMLTWPKIVEMQQRRITFGAHTVNHPRLPEIPSSEAEAEIESSKHLIEERLGAEIDYFAYPYGLYDEKTKNFVKKAGYKLACSTRSGFNNVNTDAYALRRIEVYGTDPVWKLSQKITFGITDASFLFPFKYYAKRFEDVLRRQIELRI